MVLLDILINLAIFLVTLYIVAGFFRKDGEWTPDRARKAFRFFTTLSNVLCACAALLVALSRLSGELPQWVWTLKYVGTAAVTVTMLTVFLFLAPSIGEGWVKILLGGFEAVVHLVTPLLAILSFCLLEKRGMSFLQSLWGMLPVLLYGPLYLYKIVFAPPEKRWEDFYGFNKHGKWPVAFAFMAAGTFALCMAFMLLQNL